MLTFTPTPGTGDLLLNPNFVNPTQGNFSLASNSQLINAGQFGYDMGGVSYAARPVVPTNLQISTQPNQFNAHLSWTNPALNTDGTPISSITNVQILRNDQIIATLTGMTPGGVGSYDDTVPLQSNYRYKVLAVTTVNGLYAFTREQWIGPPITALPTGPDAYGYIACESNDPGGQPYNWLEISPPSGPGTALTFTQDDETITIALPFAFQYYGMDYNQVSICSNGWIAMGTTTDTDYSNTAIPNTDGPPAMLAPFWEDLSPQVSGRVSTYYDNANHRFVVEFYQVRQYLPNTAYETFEVVLYDPAYYPTTTGDGKILFQWQDVTDVTTVTFGIENQVEAVGIQLGLDNSFAPTIVGILDNTAILFTPPAQAFPVVVTLMPVNPPIVIQPGGGSFNATIALSPPQVNPQTFDVWIDMKMPDGSINGPLMQRTITLAPGQSVSRTLTQSVPGSAPPGIYEYRSFIGNVALGVIWSMDLFEFTKSGVDLGASGSWLCSEADLEAELMAAAPESCLLPKACPNPFNPTTAISYQLPVDSRMTLKIYDASGRLVTELVNGWRAAGTHQVTFNGSGLPSGIYLLRLEAGKVSATQKLVLLK